MSRDQDTNLTRPAPGSAEASRLALAASHRFTPSGTGTMQPQLRDALSDAIRSIVLPRMLERRRALAAGNATDRHGDYESRPIRDSDVAALLACVIAADPAPAMAVLESVKRRTANRDMILRELMAPVARGLYRLKREHRLTHADLTLGMGRLRSLVRSGAMPD